MRYEKFFHLSLIQFSVKKYYFLKKKLKKIRDSKKYERKNQVW